MSDIITTPKLRFPEFSGEWHIKKLGDVVNVIDGDRGINYPKQSDFSDKGYCLFLNAGNVTRNGFDFNNVVFISEARDKLLSKGKLRQYDIVLTTRGTVGNFAYFSEDTPFQNVRINSGMVLLRSRSQITARYLYAASASLTKQIKAIAFGSAQPQLTVGSIKKFTVGVPNADEQEKIAGFLIAVDERIRLIDKKAEQLKKYKKGVMQKIFTQKIRFKDEDGHDYPAWRENQLDSVVASFSTGLNPRDNFSLGKGENYYITIKNIKAGNLDFNKAERVDNDALKLINNRSKLAAKDIIMASIGNVGDAYLLYKAPKCWDINESVFALKPNQAKILPEFLYYVITLNKTQKGMESLSTGSSFKSIKMAQLKSMLVQIPVIYEQQKIAYFLTSIDEKIKAEELKLEQAKLFKKSLLQRMFV